MILSDAVARRPVESGEAEEFKAVIFKIPSKNRMESQTLYFRLKNYFVKVPNALNIILFWHPNNVFCIESFDILSINILLH